MCLLLWLRIWQIIFLADLGSIVKDPVAESA
jgi:hypothetical protein